MKKSLGLLFAGISCCIINFSANASINLPTPISFTSQSHPINPELVDQNDLSQLEVQFNGSNNPQVLLVLDNAIIKYYDGNSNYKWKTIHSGTGWDGGLHDAGGGTTKIVSKLKAKFNQGSDPYIVVGEWGGFVDFYNGSTWQAISTRNFYYANVSFLDVKFNGTNLPSVVAGYGQGDGDINLFNGNSDLSWDKINPKTNWNSYTLGYTTQNIFPDQDDTNYPPSMIAYMWPIDTTNPQYICYYKSSTQAWQPLVQASAMDHGIGEVYAQFSASNFVMAFSILPNSSLPVQAYKIVFYNGSSWINLLNTSTPMTGLFDIQFNGTDNPYVLASTMTSGLAFYNGKTWNKIPNPEITITKLYTQFNGTNNPYILAGDNFNVIKFFNGTEWLVLNSGNKNLSQSPLNGKSSIIRVQFNGSSYPYVVVADIQNDAAFFFNGTKWTAIYQDTTLAKEHVEEQQAGSEESGTETGNVNEILNDLP
ncbi:MAG TPA: hypothetical protein DD381_03385 [Lentisphaeria bacterium]|nr:MAG: hypothetical protein A2X47_02865 [Lentisphaerae bacterium GWF2_38_69]HBM15375.1 hypothetical protein [Lentisphaeria bacterium]